MTEGKFFREEKIPTGAAEKAAVFQTEDPAHVESNPDLQKVLSEVGLTADDFRKLVTGEFEDAQPFYEEDLPFNGLTEHVRVRLAKVGGREIEVSECSRTEDSTAAPSSYDFQLRQAGPAAKILVGLGGEALLRLPKVEPAGLSQIHLYALTGEFDDVAFHKGSVAIIQAPTTWSFESSKAGLRYLYISTPRHQEEIDKTVDL